MATVPGPPTALSDVRSVFGAPAGTPLHAFVRNGAYVPDIPQNANVPTAPPIRLASLAGATNYVPPSVSVADVFGDTQGGTSNAYIGTANIVASNGQPPYSYQTVYVSGTSYNLSNTNTAHPSFNQPGRPPGPGQNSGVYKAIVTDALNNQASQNFNVTNNIS
jgi:hypothetical protein